MKLFDGKSLAQTIRQALKKEIATLSKRKPGLAFILIGDDPASQSYVRMKKKGCEEVDIHSEILTLPENVSQKGLLGEIDCLNRTDHIDGILVQQPFPKQVSVAAINEAIDPGKDVDGFHPMNMGRLLLGEDNGLIPCTPLGILALMEHYGIDCAGKEVVIVGRSNIVGKPLAALLMQKKRNATVTLAHSATKNLDSVCKRGDILISAVGQPGFITPKRVKQRAVVIDVGITRTKKGLVGDVDFEAVKETASMLTPVPGGVGPLTIAMLLSNTLKSYKKRCAI